MLLYVLGCGNGKYLNVNPSVVTVGADRCNRLLELAREKDNQVRPRTFQSFGVYTPYAYVISSFFGKLREACHSFGPGP